MGEQTPAGWYPVEGGMRYWDGNTWTEHIRPPETHRQPGSGALPYATAQPQQGGGVFGALKKAAASQRVAREERDLKQAEDRRAAGTLVTRGVFGTSTVEIYDGRFVRVASWGEGVKATEPKAIDDKTPYEKLRSIKLALPVQDHKSEPSGKNSPLEGAVGPAVAALLKGGAKAAMKGSVPGLAVAGIAHLTSAKSDTSFLTIATDKQIHTLTNQSSNGFVSRSNKGHIEVGIALLAAGNAVLGIVENPDTQPGSAEQPAAETQPMIIAPPTTGPTVGARLRELAELHRDGILSDDEFTTAKAKLLGEF